MDFRHFTLFKRKHVNVLAECGVVVTMNFCLHRISIELMMVVVMVQGTDVTMLPRHKSASEKKRTDKIREKDVPKETW